MSRDDSKKLTTATLGRGVVDPTGYCIFDRAEALVAPVYGDEDLSVVVWNLEPGQDNAAHVHAANGHTLLVLQGSGAYVKDGNEQVPIGAGDCVIVPRGVVHGVRNTGTERLSYLAVTSVGDGGYVRGAAGS
jgi:mannose-6-phosphate isomerase-like protein (cupin superfamily)